MSRGIRVRRTGGHPLLLVAVAVAALFADSEALSGQDPIGLRAGAGFEDLEGGWGPFVDRGTRSEYTLFFYPGWWTRGTSGVKRGDGLRIGVGYGSASYGADGDFDEVLAINGSRGHLAVGYPLIQRATRDRTLLSLYFEGRAELVRLREEKDVTATSATRRTETGLRADAEGMGIGGAVGLEHRIANSDYFFDFSFRYGEFWHGESDLLETSMPPSHGTYWGFNFAVSWRP